MTALVERHGLTPAAGRATRFTAMVVVASPFVRETLVRSLRSLGAADVVEAGSLAEARIRARSGGARELCIVDGALPDGSGIALVGELRALGWARGLLLSCSEDPYTVRAALAAGVRGFLVTQSASQHSHQPQAPSGGDRVAGRSRPLRTTGAEGLSGREVEVLQLVGDGRSNKDIGEALGLSALTVKSHLARIARKLGTGDRAEMVIVAMRAGVVA
ncbi:MAG: response regulator transcription factor [Actinomycetes bacterium]